MVAVPAPRGTSTNARWSAPDPGAMVGPMGTSTDRPEGAGHGLAAWLLRGGLAFVFVYACIAGLIDQQAFATYLPGFFPAPLIDIFVPLFAVFELALAVALVRGRHTFAASLIAALTLVAIVVLNPAKFAVLFRNVAIVCAALALAVQTRDTAAARALLGRLDRMRARSAAVLSARRVAGVAAAVLVMAAAGVTSRQTQLWLDQGDIVGDAGSSDRSSVAQRSERGQRPRQDAATPGPPHTAGVGAPAVATAVGGSEGVAAPAPAEVPPLVGTAAVSDETDHDPDLDLDHDPDDGLDDDGLDDDDDPDDDDPDDDSGSDDDNSGPGS